MNGTYICPRCENIKEVTPRSSCNHYKIPQCERCAAEGVKQLMRLKNG